MNDKPVIDPARDRAFRAMIVENARAGSARPSLRGRASLLIGLVVAALLVSGGGVAVALSGILPDPVAAPSPVATVTPTPTPTTTAAAPPVAPPEPEPTPTPTPTTVDVGTWIIGFDGIGPIAFGGTMEEAAAALDTTDLIPFDWNVEDCRSDLRRVPGNANASISVDVDEDGVGAGLLAVSNYVRDGVQEPAVLPRTVEGITAGSTGADLLAAYPTISEADPISSYRVYVLAGDSGRRLFFLVDAASDLVDSISLSDSDTFQLGGCGA